MEDETNIDLAVLYLDVIVSEESRGSGVVARQAVCCVAEGETSTPLGPAFRNVPPSWLIEDLVSHVLV